MATRIKLCPVLAASAALLAGCAGPEAGLDPAPPPGEAAAVLRVIDGDTIDVRVGGQRERVRLLGIDAPERTTLRTGRTECGGEQAREALVRVLRDGPGVLLTEDPSQGRRDRYDRLLAYLDPADGGASVQEQLLEQGWVTTFIRRSDPIDRAARFRAAAERAQRARAGVWRECGGDFRRPE